MVDEQLFISEPEFTINSYTVNTEHAEKAESYPRYCSCEDEAGSTDNFQEFNTVQCNLTETTEFCTVSSGNNENTINSFYTTCLSSGRRKRSTRPHEIFRRSSIDEDNDDVIDFQPLTYDDESGNTDVSVCLTMK